MLHISKSELFEISKFRNILLAIFKCRVFSIFCHLAGEKTDRCFDMYAQGYAHFKLYEQELSLLQLLHTYKLEVWKLHCKLYLSLAGMARKMIYDYKFLN